MADTDPDIVEVLMRWRADDFSADDLNVLYDLSPEWRRRVLELWKAYDELELRQKLFHVPRLEWQDKTDTVRGFNLRDAVSIIHPAWTEAQHPMIPLQAHLTVYLGRPDPDPDRRLYPWRSALADWHMIRKLYREDPGYARNLSVSQERSLLVLEQWWTSSCDDPEPMEATRTFLEEWKDEEDTTNPIFYPEDFAEEAMTDSGLFHATGFHLFLLELHPRAWRPYDGEAPIQSLQSARVTASHMLLYQRIAYAVLRPDIAANPRERPYPRRIDLRPDLLLGADPRAAVTRKPYYLWDSERQATVQVDKLPTCPEYVCISHTWGRWRTRTNTPVSGVPWLVPENTLHDVRHLPDRLRQLNFRYIWLDLFCIPQDRGDRSKEEIANQASIFRGSHHCIAWLHDINSWEGTVAAVDWLGLKYMRLTSRDAPEDMEARISTAANAATGPAELWVREKWAHINNGDLYEAYGEPSSWFSSLWTLQELTLCPDMELYSRDWQRLEDRRGAAIPLRCLVLFVDHMSGYLGRSPPEDTPFHDASEWRRKMTTKLPDLYTSLRGPHVPIGALDLIDVFSVTNLANVLRSSFSMDVLMTANLRQCSSKNRAPAIMSALGVTEWYTRSLGSMEPPALVFDMYPLGFLEETARKLGGFFWDTDHDLPREGPETGDDVDAMRQASMLPVSSRPGFLGRVLGTPAQGFMSYEDHPSVATWRINGDGGVTIGSAAVLLRTGTTNSKMEGRISCADKTFRSALTPTFGKVDDLAKALKGMVIASRRICGVALYKAGRDIHGILLEELARRGSRTYLVKIGSFRVWDVPIPEAETVDWEVV